MTINSLKLWAFALCLVLLVTSACAVRKPQTPESIESTLKKEVHRLWTARVEKEWETVYNMSDNEYQRQITQGKFVEKSHIDVKGFEIKSVEVTDDAGASFVIFKTIKMAMPFEISIREKWILENDSWRLKRSEQLTPFSKPTGNK